jgi:hypothetical protein
LKREQSSLFFLYAATAVNFLLNTMTFLVFSALVSLSAFVSSVPVSSSINSISRDRKQLRLAVKAARRKNRVVKKASRKPDKLSLATKLAARKRRLAKRLAKTERGLTVVSVLQPKRKALNFVYNPIARDAAQLPVLCKRKTTTVEKPVLRVLPTEDKALARPVRKRKVTRPVLIKAKQAVETVVAKVTKVVSKAKVKVTKEKPKTKSEHQLKVEAGRLADLKPTAARHLPTIMMRQGRVYGNEHRDEAIYDECVLMFQNQQNVPVPEVEPGLVEATSKTEQQPPQEVDAMTVIFSDSKNFGLALNNPLPDRCARQHYHALLKDVVLQMRAIYGGGFGLPTNVDGLLLQAGILPEFFVDKIPGGRELQRLICQISGSVESYPTRYRGSHETAPQSSLSVDWQIVTTSVPNYKYADVFNAIVLKDRARKGEAPCFSGLDVDTARACIRPIKEAMAFAYWQGNVFVPATVKEALDLFLRASGYMVECNFVGIDEAWLMPLHGLQYEVVKETFAAIGQIVTKYLGKNAVAGVAPLMFVETNDGFELVVSGGNKFIVTAPNSLFPAQAYMQPMDSVSLYHMRPFVAGANGVVGKLAAKHCVKLSSLDALWYAFEAYGFANINRDFVSNPKLSDMKGGYFSRFVRKCLPVQYVEDIRDIQASSGRAILEANKYVACKVNMAMPVLLMRRTDSNGSYLSLQGSHLALESTSINAYYGQLAERNMLYTCNALSMTEVAAREFGLVTNPNGAVKDFIEESLVTVNNWTKDKVVAMLANGWLSGGFDKTIGKFDPKNERSIVEALWTIQSLKWELGKAGITLHEAYGSKSELFWEVVCRELRVAISSKTEKFVKRAVMAYAQALETNLETEAGWRSDVHNVSRITPVPALVLPNLLVSAGMGFLDANLFKAYYNTKVQLAKVVCNTNIQRVWLEIDAVYSSEPLVTQSYAEERVSGYKFATKTLVKQGDVIGRVMTSDTVGNAVCYGTLTVPSDGYLVDVKTTEEIDPGAERRVYVTATLKCQVVNTVKLRSEVVLKLNALSVNLDRFLGYEDLNGRDFAAVKAVITGDSFKASDNFVATPKLVGHQYAVYGKVVSEMRDLLVKTNLAAAAYAGVVLPTYADWLFIDAGAVTAGVYNEIFTDFNQRFGVAAWIKEVSPNSDMPRIKAAHTRNRAVATNYLNEDKTARLKNEPWRFVSSEELSYLQNGALPTEVIDSVLALEKTGTYTDSDWIEGKAFACTDAVGAIGEKDTVYIYWTTVDSDANIEHHMLTRSYGWGSKDGLDLLYPVEVEAGTIPEAVSSTSMLPSETVWLSLTGHKAAAQLQLKEVVKNVAFDGILQRTLTGASIQIGSAPAEAIDTSNLREFLSALVDTEAEVMLQSYTLGNVTDARFLEVLARVLGHRTLKIKRGNAWLNVHLQTMYDWNKGSLLFKGDSAVKELTNWLKLVLIYEVAPTSEQMLRSAQSIFNLLNAYYNGRNHLRSTLRGVSTACMKAAACVIVPDGELWLTQKTAQKLAASVGSKVENIEHVVFRRMPMAAGCVCKLRVLSNADLTYYRERYGVLFCYGLAYMGSISMYVNFGDLDGDAISIADCTYEVSKGLVNVTAFDAVANMLAEITGADVFDWTYWLGNAPDQYVADHFVIGNWNKFLKKVGFNWSKNVMCLDKLIEMQVAAGSVQSITVGYTYRASVLAMLMAEMMPVACEALLQITGEVPTWLKKFSWMLDEREASITCGRLLQVYEIALGGYSSDMANVTLGYLNRALQANCSNDSSLPASISERLDLKTFTSFETIVPELKVRKFTHLPETLVRESFANLGFMPGDFERFRDIYILAGACTSYTKDKFGSDDLNQLPIELRFIFVIAQLLLDVSQAKLEAIDKGEGNVAFVFLPEMALKNLITNVNEMAQSSDPVDVKRATTVVEMFSRITSDTIAGQMFSVFMANVEAVRAENFVYNPAG